jgi:hypothetical protein
MARPFKGLEYKDFHTTFTKSDEEPPFFTSVGNSADSRGLAECHDAVYGTACTPGNVD